MSEEEKSSISEQFFKAQHLHRDISSGTMDARTGEYQNAVKDVLNIFLKVWSHVQNEGVLSANEQISDMSSRDLKYVLCPFYIGDLCMCAPGADGRLGRVKNAIKFLKKFLDLCHSTSVTCIVKSFLFSSFYFIINVRSCCKIMNEEDQACYKRGGEPARLPPHEQRAAKVAQYKHQQQIEKQMDEVIARQRSAHALACVCLVCVC